MENDADAEQVDDASDHEAYEAIDGIEAETPGQGLKKAKADEPNKKQRTEEVTEDDTDLAAEAEASQRGQEKVSKKAAKKAAKKQKAAERAEKAEKKAGEPAPGKKQDAATAEGEVLNVETDTELEKQEEKPQNAPAAAPAKQEKSKPDAKPKGKRRKDGPAEEDALLGSGAAFSGLQGVEEMSVDSAPDSERPTPTFDTPDHPPTLNGAPAEPASTTTSISSTIPPSEKPKHLKMPQDMNALRARLAAKIEALRAARKADGPDGKPIRTRQELIESRRFKEAKRLAHKQELKKQAKLEAARQREEELASNSPSVMSPAVEIDETGNYAFGRVAFEDGAQLSHDLSYVLNAHKKKGPSDPKTALLKVQNEKKRIEALDDDKREDVEEKEAWLAARRRVEGEKVRDNEAILKKAVKRKETAKKKSEKEWKDRAQGIGKAQKDKQRKREDNLKKRRDEKILGKAGKKKKGPTKKKARPGFEGSFGVGGRKK